MTEAKTDSVENTLAGKTALITGGSLRVGKAVALQLAQVGMNIAITYLQSGPQAQALVGQIQAMGQKALAIKVDLSKPDAGARVFDAFGQHFDQLYALVNNASSFTPSPMDQVTAEDFDFHMAVNARAPLMLIKQFTPMLKNQVDKSPGRIVNFIDIHVLGQPLKGHVAYNASKAALHQITLTAAMELSPHITVNAIAPGVVAWASSYSEQMKSQYMSRVPMARPGTPQDAARAVLFLVRDADYCTGQVIKLDGGRLLT